MRHRLALGSILGWAVACSSTPAATPLQPQCTVNQFRACEADACQAVQQCVEPGLWSACHCVTLDASYAQEDAATDAQDAATDAQDATTDVEVD